MIEVQAARVARNALPSGGRATSAKQSLAARVSSAKSIITVDWGQNRKGRFTTRGGLNFGFSEGAG